MPTCPRDRPRYQFSATFQNAILSYSKNKEAAKELIKYLLEATTLPSGRAGQGYSTSPTRSLRRTRCGVSLTHRSNPLRILPSLLALWLCRTSQPQGRRGLVEVHYCGHVCQSHPGDAGEGRH